MASENSGLISQAYQQYLGRNPEEGALEYHGNAAANQGLNQVIENIKASPEGKMRADKLATATGQMDKILSSDSPLMKRAETQGKQYANSRGLLNSSMAAGASQGAMIDAAMPMAQQDAGYQQDLAKMQADYGFSSDLSTQQANQTLNQLYATSTANAWGVMANNLTDIVGQYSSQLERIQTNPDIQEADKVKMIEQVLSMRDTDIQFQKSLYEQLPTYLANTGVFPNR